MLAISWQLIGHCQCQLVCCCRTVVRDCR